MRTVLLLLLPLLFYVCLCSNLSLASSVVSMSKPNCNETCGNITVPYPFGIGLSCSANSSFLVICRHSSSPPTLLLPSISMQVLNISVEGTVVVKSPVVPMNCTSVQKTVSVGKQFAGSPFMISADRNTFVVLGCRNSVLMTVNETLLSGCTPTCRPDYHHGGCTGVNCCQTYIPPRSHELKYTYQSIQDGDNGSCGYAFPVDKTWLGKGYGLYKGLGRNFSNPFDDHLVSVPLVLDWELTDANISEFARCNVPYVSGMYFSPSCSYPYDLTWKFSCYVHGTPSLDGYDDQPAKKRCSCGSGFRGNPYLDEGCVDVDECQNPNACQGMTCVNAIGYYNCFDPLSGTRVRNIVLITVGSLLGAGIIVLGFIGAYRSIKLFVKRFKAHRRKKFFKRNGGLLLEQKLSSNDNGYKKSKLFTSKELAQATDHYSENRVLGRGGQGTVYKGMLTDGTIVAVKKSIKVHESDIELFINEVVILSQINHRNIVKLLGCCLETEIPLLVYEFVPNGTLFQHIQDPGEDFPLTWETRLRIAAEIAGALSYLHSSASAPIFHRDIKSTNILLDEKYRAKISDFGTSRTAAVDQTHVTTRVFGTFGYMDPEYFQSNQFTEKSDVYSFGVVMVELITGEKAISLLRDETGRSLAAYFLHSMEEGKLFDIVDATIIQEEGRREEIETVAELSRRCLHLNGKLRPTMRQVANELLQINKPTEQSHDFYGASEAAEPPPPIEPYDFSSSMLSLTLER